MNRLLLSKLAKLRNVSVERTTTLRQRVSTTEPDRDWIAQALEELEVAQEELRVTEEELRTQSAELSAVYGALDRDRRRYRELFDGAPEPSLVTDAAGVVHEANRLACRLLGVEPRFLIGKPLDVFVWPDDKPRARSLLPDIGRASEVSTFDLRLKPRGAAEALAVTMTARRTRGDDERAVAIHWILHEQAASLGTNLVLPAHSGSSAALNRVESVETAGTKTAGVAVRQHVVDILTRRVKAHAGLVQDLIDQTRIVQDLVVLNCKQCDLRALLERLCEEACESARSEGVQFDYTIARDISRGRCDPHRVQQAVYNVIDNALRVAAENNGPVRFEAALRGKGVECVVRDSGPGIPEESIATVFEPCIRVNDQGASTGLGLGLHLARKLIELHDGTINAETGAGHPGTTFRIWLPLEGPRST